MNLLLQLRESVLNSADPQSGTRLQHPWYLVFLLFLAYLLSFLDRQIIVLMVDPIKQDLELSDFQFSLLHGIGFGLFYAVFGIPIAIAADRYRRTRIIGIGIVIWSAMTAVCGLAFSYLQLFLGRIGVGVGEAALAPAAYSLLSDSFDKRRLPQAVAVFSIGSTVGSGLALVLGGQLLDWMSHVDRSGVRWLAAFSDWQLAFMIAGLPGLLLAIFIFRLREPPRKGFLTTTRHKPVRQLKVTTGYLWRNRRLYGGLFSAIGVMTALSSGFIVWFPALLMREYGVPVRDAGMWFGTCFAVFASLGALAGGWVVAALWPRLGSRAYPWVIGVAVVAAGVAYAGIGRVDTVGQALTLISVAIFFTQSLAGISVTAIQLVTPNEMRAQASSIFLLFVNLLGFGAGAPIVAALNDYVFRDSGGLSAALAATAWILAPLALLGVVLAAGAYRRARLYVD